MTGKVYGVGVGPGDPQLLTLKAATLIRQARHLAYMVNGEGQSMARTIAAGFIGEAEQEIAISMPMHAGPEAVREAYDTGAGRIGEVLDRGEDVVVLCEGDPLFYGSFIYIQARLAGKADIEVVPGIASPMAGAAALGRPLCARDETLTILPATLPEAILRERIETADAAVIMKLGRNFAKLRRVLDGLGLSEKAGFVERVTWPEQKVCRLADAPDEPSYFALVIVSKGDGAWT